MKTIQILLAITGFAFLASCASKPAAAPAACTSCDKAPKHVNKKTHKHKHVAAPVPAADKK